ncbi:methylaspartate mutase [Amycolatopsis sp. H20-H5]|uniref:methylaspartate mutase n=1 Tax=Amycolatopsis sp. H20-H5 TaxID=3046309 RepID=UPI002DB885C6|nr:methylaspartate mutase [Amycolatopsis sp. H20-H5]MEC3978516.1 methylaspartate mutase [Amycolatopsis sp. H20-H5]
MSHELGAFVRRSAALVVQPRMGFATAGAMRAGLAAVRGAGLPAVGTITLDSYTRVGDHAAARRALDGGRPLNGFPIVAHGPAVTDAVLDGLAGPDFPVQVRHGSAVPGDIVRAMERSGLVNTEGGPVSYCLPYGRTPLAESVANWRRAADLLAARDEVCHVETFGGCLLGQLCPPALLVAVSVLEAVFFRQRGLRSLSLSYAQQTNAAQDLEALAALRSLATRLLPGVRWHIVLYTYMGVFPRSESGALRLIADSARLAVRGGAARIIVKTSAEAHRIPTVEENLRSLRLVHDTAAATGPGTGPVPDTGLAAEATALVEAVLSLDPDVGEALILAFRLGLLDVPYCLHADNAGRTRSVLDSRGRLRWASVGRLPLPRLASGARRVGAADLLRMLSAVERRYDHHHQPAPLTGAPTLVEGTQ